MADDVTLPGTGSVVATEESGGKHYQKVALVDENLTQITPASSDDITNKDIMITLKVLAQLIANPAYLDQSLNQIRAVVTGTSTVTFASNQDIRNITGSLAAVTNQVSMDGYQGKLIVLGIDNTSWQLGVRNKIT